MSEERFRRQLLEKLKTGSEFLREEGFEIEFTELPTVEKLTYQDGAEVFRGVRSAEDAKDSVLFFMTPIKVFGKEATHIVKCYSNEELSLRFLTTPELHEFIITLEDIDVEDRLRGMSIEFIKILGGALTGKMLEIAIKIVGGVI